MNGGGGEGERETQNPQQAPGSELSARSPMGARTLRLWDHDLSWSGMLNWLSHPGTSDCYCSDHSYSLPSDLLYFQCLLMDTLSHLLSSAALEFLFRFLFRISVSLVKYCMYLLILFLSSLNCLVFIAPIWILCQLHSNLLWPWVWLLENFLSSL